MTDEEETVEEVTEERPQTIAEAFDAINRRIDEVVGENERLRTQLASLGTVGGSGESADSDSGEGQSESSTAEELESSGGESSQGEPEVEYREPDEPPRAVHRWWRNPIGGS